MNPWSNKNKRLKLPVQTGLCLIFACTLGFPQWAWSQGRAASDKDNFAKNLEAIVALPQDERVAAFIKLADMSDLALSGVQLTAAEGDSRIRPPKELLGGWAAGIDSGAKVRRIAGADANQQLKLDNAILIWTLFLAVAPQEAFAAMLSRADSNTATLGDAARILAATQRVPGKPLKQKLSKQAWSQLHNSANPCCQILALEKYDSTDQSPAELLSLYRECLMDSFGYLQVRALEGIFRSRDFRPEVAVLLKEYLNSEPVFDDGTLPAFPATIGNPVDGAKMILAEISKVGREKDVVSPLSAKPLLRLHQE